MLSVNILNYGKVVLVELAGELDSAGALSLAQALEQAHTAHSTAHTMEKPALVIDLSAIGLLDIHGLRGLYAWLRRARGAGGDIRLAEPSGPALQSLNAASLHELFRIYDKSQAAIASF